MKRIILAAAFACHLIPAAADDTPVVLGALYNTSGSQAILDGPSLRGARLAALDINADGGVGGQRLNLAISEGDSMPSAWPARVAQIAGTNPSLSAFFGLSDTDNVLAAATASARLDRAFITSGATSPKLPQDVPTYLYLACFGDNVQAAAAAEWAFTEKGVRSALVLFDPNETYPTLLKDYFVARFTALGGTVSAVTEVAPRSSTPDVPDPGAVDVVFLSAETAEDAVRIISLLRAGGYSGPILGGDGYDAPEVWAAHQDLSDVFFTTHVYLGEDNPNPLVAPFIAGYEAAYGGDSPTGFSALGYDTVRLIAAAIEASGDSSPEGVLAGLAGIENFAGVTGTISFAGGTRVPRKAVTVLAVESGRQDFVASITPTDVPAP